MAMQLTQNSDLDSPVIPDRLYFKIGDVARICGVETYVLRFWETQFHQLKPNKSELALKIKHLVRDEGYTLVGARQVLEQDHRHHAPQPVLLHDPQSRLPLLVTDSGEPPTKLTLDEAAKTIANARAELREIASLLASPEPQPPHRRPRLALISSASDSLFPSS